MISKTVLTQCHERHAKLLYAALRMGWSPEKVRLQMKRETPELRLSPGTLYRRIAADKTQGRNLYTKLPRFGKSRFKGGKHNRGRALIPNRVDSIQRSQVVENTQGLEIGKVIRYTGKMRI